MQTQRAVSVKHYTRGQKRHFTPDKTFQMIGRQSALGTEPVKNTRVAQRLPLRAQELVANSETATSK